jgi:phospholipase/carboxylesterase
VLVLLHGLGSNERDLLGLGAGLDPRFELISLRAPRPMGPDAFGWFDVTFKPEGPVHDGPQAETARRAIVRFLEELKRRPGVDAERVFLLGFSQGAILGISVALTEPGLVRGVVAVSGRTLPELAERKATGEVLVLHGTRDTRLPYALAENSREVLTRGAEGRAEVVRRGAHARRGDAG